MRNILTNLIIFMIASSALYAQNKVGGVLDIDKLTHDFGDIELSQGPVSCTFTVKNISDKPLAIYNVVSSCGCTDVKWTREPIAPGKTGTVSATYSNDEGAYPFEKTLTAYFSGMKQPVILRLKGESHAKKLPLSEMYSVHFGALGMKESEIKVGNLSQGQQKSGEVTIANISSKPMKLSFTKLSPGLKVNVSQASINANTTAKISYTVTADRSLWGKNYYYATPVVNGKEYSPVAFWAFTKEDFSSLTKEQKNAGPNPSFKTSTFSFNPMKAGAKVQASYDLTNEGKEELVIYKIDSDNPKAKMEPIQKLAPGAKCKVSATLDTAGMPKGEVLVIMTLTTNSPLRPIVNLYITGFIN